MHTIKELIINLREDLKNEEDEDIKNHIQGQLYVLELFIEPMIIEKIKELRKLGKERPEEYSKTAPEKVLEELLGYSEI